MSKFRVHTKRVAAVDVARGLASLIMIQGHAYDGWASPTAKTTTLYAFTRFLGTFPLPAFLVLAGAALAFRVDAAVDRNEDANTIRLRIVTRGLQIVLYGYATNFAYALFDGWDSLGTLLRADVLHCIGVSIALTGWFGVVADAPETYPSRRRLANRAILLGVGATLLCPWITRLTSEQNFGALGFVVGLLADVPGTTLMPVIPLIAWLSVGVVATQLLLRSRRWNEIARWDFSPRTVVTLGIVGMIAASIGKAATAYALAHGGGPLSRTEPIVWLNVIDLAGLGLIILTIGAVTAAYVSGSLLSGLVHLGRGVTCRVRLSHSVLLWIPRATDDRSADDAEGNGRSRGPGDC